MLRFIKNRIEVAYCDIVDEKHLYDLPEDCRLVLISWDIRELNRHYIVYWSKFKIKKWWRRWVSLPKNRAID